MKFFLFDLLFQFFLPSTTLGNIYEPNNSSAPSPVRDTFTCFETSLDKKYDVKVPAKG